MEVISNTQTHTASYPHGVDTGENHLILTVDYEVFGNGSGCIRHCVCAPLERMAQIAETYGARLEIFVEAVEFAAMEQSSDHAEAVVAVKQQLSDMLSRGHGIQLHIHPQWEGAIPVDGKWVFNADTWRTGDLTSEQLHQLLESACSWISQAVKNVSPNYKPAIFRAGGWCIQPSNHVVPLLRTIGLQADSSVAPGTVNHDAASWYDFKRSPSQAWWPVDVDVDQVGSSDFLEIPIAAGRVNPVKHLRSRLARRKEGELAAGCSGSYRGRSDSTSRMTHLLQKAHKARWAMLDYCTLSSELMIDVLRDWIRRFDTSETAVPVVAIGHTKNFSEAAARELEAFLRWISEQETLRHSSYRNFYEALSAGDRRKQCKL